MDIKEVAKDTAVVVGSVALGNQLEKRVLDYALNKLKLEGTIRDLAKVLSSAGIVAATQEYAPTGSTASAVGKITGGTITGNVVSKIIDKALLKEEIPVIGRTATPGISFRPVSVTAAAVPVKAPIPLNTGVVSATQPTEILY